MATAWTQPLSYLVFTVFLLIASVVSAPSSTQTNKPTPASWQDAVRQRAPDFKQCPKKFKFDRPLVLLQSLDGFAARFVDQVPAVKFLSQQAVYAPYMRPVFPTSTYPNHYSIATGLYPESHGIIDQSFASADNTTYFVNSKPSHTISDFWKGQPIWQVAERQGKKVFTRYWPGGDVVIKNMQPSKWSKYNGSEPVESIAQTVLDWIQLPKEERPAMILAYFREPDTAGHESLENTDRFRTGLKDVDKYLNKLMTGLASAGLRDCVDLIVVSDHGIDQCRYTVDPHVERINPVDVHRGSGAMNRVKLTKNADIEKAVSQLSCDSENSPYQVYSKSQLPVRLHYVNADTIAPVLVLPNTSFVLFPTGSNDTCADRFNMHGWDNLYDKMKAFFMAYGPSFKTKTLTEPFENVELFNLFCDLLGVECVVNNGTNGSMRHLLRPEKEQTLSEGDKDQGNAPTATAYVSQQDNRMDALCKENCPQKADLSTLKQITFNLKEDSDIGGLPRSSPGVRNVNISVLRNHDYMVGYNNKQQVASWVKFELPKMSGNVLAKKMQETGKDNCLYADPRTAHKPEWTLPCAGLKTSDKSAKVISAPLFPLEMATKNEYQAEARLTTNFMPMYETFYHGLWNPLLRLAVSWNTEKTPLRLYLGPVWDRRSPFGFADDYVDASKKNDLNATIPSHFYLVVLKQRDNPPCPQISCHFDVTSFILPHRPKNTKPCQSDRLYFLTNTASVKDVERITGLRFFPSLPWQEAVRLRTRLTDYLWDDHKSL